MKKQIRIFLAGVMVVTPFAVTAYVIWWAGTAMDGLVRSGIEKVSPGIEDWWFPGAGIIFLLVGVYVIGLLTHLWAFRWAVRIIERIFSRLPGVKSIYESVRDVLNIFGGDANRMGQVVRYRIPGTEIDLLGIRTSTSPRPSGGADKVAVYLPMSYMIGGPTVYVSPDSLEPIDMSVEEAMKIAATAGAAGGETTDKK
ncbi:MAG: DUF502 domain-containing protein [Planctomycetota bacterium]|nr:DUF502 domain-containing protein [Planctomycetota bacterium]